MRLPEGIAIQRLERHIKLLREASEGIHAFACTIQDKQDPKDEYELGVLFSASEELDLQAVNLEEWIEDDLQP